MSRPGLSKRHYDPRGLGQATWRRTQAVREGGTGECGLPWSGGADSRRARAQIPRAPRICAASGRASCSQEGG